MTTKSVLYFSIKPELRKMRKKNLKRKKRTNLIVVGDRGEKELSS
jgi:hypothetical protein